MPYTAPTKLKTVGVSPKVPVQAIVTVIVAALAYFGVELSAEVSGILAAIAGIIGGVAAPPGQVTRTPAG